MTTSPTTAIRRRLSTISSSQYSPTTSSSPPELFANSVSTQSEYGESHHEIDAAHEGPWIFPKIEEEVEDELQKLKDAKPLLASLPATPPVPTKRGRPKKYPSVEPRKVSHARSKTGCGTCRRRKKKCDEQRPRCANCEKNNVFCDGYKPLQEWQSGKQKLLTGSPSAPLPHQIQGVESQVDLLFYDHFVYELANVLSLTDSYNPFKTIILPMAMNNSSLMHSVLYLSGSCLNANRLEFEWQARESHHCLKALAPLRLEKITESDSLAATDRFNCRNGDIAIAQSLVFFLQTVCAGDTEGLYLGHLNAMKFMLTDADFVVPDEKLRQFLLEFVLYHDYCASITSIENNIDEKSKILVESKLPQSKVQPGAGTLLGVLDGLFELISRIRWVRDQVRYHLESGKAWYLLDKHVRNEIFDIDNKLREWSNPYPSNSPRHVCSSLYRHCLWIYLNRAAHPFTPGHELEAVVDQGLVFLSQLPWETDPAATQSILLMPLFLLGCAAFKQHQREPILKAFDRIQQWSRLANIKHARFIVEEIWAMMDNGQAEKTWDWEAIIASYKLKVLFT